VKLRRKSGEVEEKLAKLKRKGRKVEEKVAKLKKKLRNCRKSCEVEKKKTQSRRNSCEVEKRSGKVEKEKLKKITATTARCHAVALTCQNFVARLCMQPYLYECAT
jgi:DNA anti-recombination protein RmuC